MSDRELLELAAKAYGFGATRGTCWTKSEYPRGSGLEGALWNYVGHMDTAELWNPLTDDGDAFRLAVALKLFVEYFPDFESEMSDIRDSVDQQQAARRAVVNAAAKIGASLS